MLKTLENLPGVSGMETEVRNYLQEQLEPICTSVNTDSMGNLHAYQKGIGPEILLIAYMDEPGIIVTQITEDGYLRFEPIGRINPSFLVSKRVFFGEIPGIISLKAIHLTTKKEREIPTKTKDLFIDIGASSKEEAKKFVTIGDYGILDIPYIEFPNYFVKGRSVAGRMSCLAAFEILKKYPQSNIHAIFASQREVENRGILALATQTNPDLTIVFDAISAKYPQKNNDTSPESGKGVTLISHHVSGNTDAALLAQCKTIAKEKDIPLQFGTAKKTGPETVLTQMSIKNILPLAIPVRYADSTAPVANTQDMKSMIRLACFVIDAKREGGRRSL